MKHLAPIFGVVGTASIRIIIAGLSLIIYLKIVKRQSLEVQDHWKHYLFLGIINSALPFIFFNYASLHIPASYSVVLNSTTPLSGAILAFVFLGEDLGMSKVFGLTLGILGVFIIADLSEVSSLSNEFIYSMVACLIAATCYSIGSVYIKKYAMGINPISLAGVGQFMGGLIIFPFIFFEKDKIDYDLNSVLLMITFALLCSSYAFTRYYQLVREIGPSKSLTVTFLMPIFGIMWGVLFYDEVITPKMLIGAMFIIIGVFFVLKIRLKMGLLSRVSK